MEAPVRLGGSVLEQHLCRSLEPPQGNDGGLRKGALDVNDTPDLFLAICRIVKDYNSLLGKEKNDEEVKDTQPTSESRPGSGLLETGTGPSPAKG